MTKGKIGWVVEQDGKVMLGGVPLSSCNLALPRLKVLHQEVKSRLDWASGVVVLAGLGPGVLG